jgi:hypothetical protein
VRPAARIDADQREPATRFTWHLEGAAMALSLSRWRATHLLGAWALYWILLVLVKLGTGIAAALRVMNAAQEHGNVNVSMNDGVLSSTVTGDGVHWTGSASVMSIVLWLCGPPLILWVLWLVTRRAPARAREPGRDYRVS